MGYVGMIHRTALTTGYVEHGVDKEKSSKI